MAKLATAIDISEVERSGGGSFELMPFGDYVLELTAVEEKEIDGGIAHGYTYEVVEPEEFAKRRIWDTIMLDHPSNVGWVKASTGRLAKLADAVGFDAEKEGELDPTDGRYKLTDDEVLMYRAFLAKVVQREGNQKGDGTKYNDSNEVVDFYNPTDPRCPEGPSIYPVQPPMLPARGKKKAAAPANDNRLAARPAQQTAPTAGKRPWGQRAA